MQVTQTPNVALPSSTFTPSPTFTPESTATSTQAPTETPPVTVDVTQSADEWDLSRLPADQQAELRTFLADSSNGTAKQRAAFDKLVTDSWKTILKDAGVTDAESLKGYAFLEAILDYTEANQIYEAALPISLHRLILTDPDNLVPPSKRPDVEESTDRYYGLGQGVGLTSPTYKGPVTADYLRSESHDRINSINFYGEKITPTEKDPPLAMDVVGGGSRGDLVLLVNLPGIDSVKEQGALLLMYDDIGNRHYFELNIVYSLGLTTKGNDLCQINQGIGELILYKECLPSLKLSQTDKMKDFSHYANQPITHQEIIDYLSQKGSHHVELRSDDNMSGEGAQEPAIIWQNGVGTATSILFIPQVKL